MTHQNFRKHKEIVHRAALPDEPDGHTRQTLRQSNKQSQNSLSGTVPNEASPVDSLKEENENDSFVIAGPKLRFYVLPRHQQTTFELL